MKEEGEMSPALVGIIREEGPTMPPDITHHYYRQPNPGATCFKIEEST